MREDRSASANARIGRIQAADARSDQWIRAQLVELARLISEWPGLVSRPAAELIEDSLVLLAHLGEATRLVDVGAGGGLPGLPLKIARPGLSVTLVEADQAKAAFLVRACAALGLREVAVLARRAGGGGEGPGYPGTFDVAGAPAPAPQPLLAEVCLPFVRVGRRVVGPQ